ncbi:twinstar-like protein [Xylariaceae sp. AK1471]|nr:twinstar-like protein [Xylariaceae sp. AK1471]
MASRVAVSDDCTTKVAAISKSPSSREYIIFKVSDDNKSIIVDDSGKTSKYGDFTAKLPTTECRYAVYNFHHGNEKDGFKYSKVFISWAPDDAKAKLKMLYASSKAAIKGVIADIAVELLGTDSDDISYDTIVKKL